MFSITELTGGKNLEKEDRLGAGMVFYFPDIDTKISKITLT